MKNSNDHKYSKIPMRFLNRNFFACIVCISFCARLNAQVLFSDSFNGPTLNPIWQTNLPTMNTAGPGPFGPPLSETYIGAPTYSFQTIGGSSVIRMNEQINQQQRVGFLTSTIFTPSTFRLEARFNTLIQSSATSIDAFIEIGLLDPTDSSRYDLVSPYGGNFSTDLSFNSGSSIDNTYSAMPFNYQNNTWYRLVVSADAGQNIRLSIDDDNGNELMGRTLNHGASAYGSGFELIFSQAMGFAGNGHYSDVAVDYVTLSVPEPASASLLVIGGLALVVRRKRGSR